MEQQQKSQRQKQGQKQQNNQGQLGQFIPNNIQQGFNTIKSKASSMCKNKKVLGIIIVIIIALLLCLLSSGGCHRLKPGRGPSEIILSQTDDGKQVISFKGGSTSELSVKNNEELI